MAFSAGTLRQYEGSSLVQSLHGGVPTVRSQSIAEFELRSWFFVNDTPFCNAGRAATDVGFGCWAGNRGDMLANVIVWDKHFTFTSLSNEERLIEG